ncbi:MAG TPA: hypothetical protein PK129_14915 [Cellvibrionaceae bacterium]|nr:hypothetical protein [Cellvibrionaceae bacterium]
MKFFWGWAVFLLSISAFAEDGCPKSILVNQSVSVEAISKLEYFSELDDKDSKLLSISVYSGHPREKADLIPDAERVISGKKVITYEFGDSSRYGGVYLLCRYTNTYYSVVVPLGNKKKCVLTFSNTQFYANRQNVFEKIDCE